MAKNSVAAEQSIETPAHISYAMKGISPGVFFFFMRETYSNFYTQVDQDGDVRMDLRSDMDPTLFGAFRPVICWSVY